MQGTLVHQALDDFGRLVVQDTNRVLDYEGLRAAFPLRRRLIAALDRYCATDLASNPRVDVAHIRARIDLDACSNAFKAAAPVLYTEMRRDYGGHTSPMASRRRTSKSVSGTEVSYRSESPRIMGQIDVISQGSLIDYKTGAPQESHWEQLRFYALLFWLNTRRVVRTLRLIYTESGEALERTAPTSEELGTYGASLRDELGAMDAEVKRATPPEARPVPEHCRNCHVRQLCPVFWKTIPSWEVAADDASQEAARHSGSTWRDVEVRLPRRMAVSRGYDGLGFSETHGEVLLQIGESKCPSEGTPTGVRLLGARTMNRRGQTTIEAARDTEVFWLYG